MTTQQLIAELQKLDPTGKLEVLTFSIDEDVPPAPYVTYYDFKQGFESGLNKDTKVIIL